MRIVIRIWGQILLFQGGDTKQKKSVHEKVCLLAIFLNFLFSGTENTWVGHWEIIESTSEKTTGSITVEIIESIMLYGFCLGMLGVDLPSVCLSVWVRQGPVSWWGWSLYCGRCEVGDGSALWELGESHASYCWVL